MLRDLAAELEKSSEFSHAGIENIYREYAEKTGLPGGKLIHPTRLAISGTGNGPGLFELMEALGKERVLRRILSAIDYMAGK